MKDKKIFLFLFFYSFIFLFFSTELSPLYNLNLWPDINIYFNMGKAMMNGQVLYQDVFDHKGPLIFFIYGIGYLISNNTLLGVYFLNALILFVGLYYTYLISNLYLNKFYSIVSVFVFSLVFITITYNGGSAEEFILLLLPVSLYYFIKYFNTNSPENAYKLLPVQGFLLSYVFLIKVNLIVYFFFPLLVIVLYPVYYRKYKTFVTNIIYILSGCLILFVPFLFYFAINNAIPDFWFSYFEFNMLYSDLKIDYHFFLGLIVKFWHLFINHPVPVIFIVSGSMYLLLSKKFIKSIWGRIAVFLSSLSLFCSVLAVPYMLDYYYLPLTIYAIPGCIILLDFISRKLSKKHSLSTLLLLSLFLITITGSCLIKGFFGNSVTDLVSRNFKPNVAEVFTNEIMKEENPTLVILGLNEGIGVFTQSGIIPNTKYFFYPNINYNTYPVIRDMQEEYVKNKETSFIILCDKNLYFNYWKKSEELHTNYSLIKSFENTSVHSGIYYLYKAND